MKNKIFKIHFNININCNGIYKNVETSLSVIGESEKEAKEKFLKDVSIKPIIAGIETIKH